MSNKRRIDGILLLDKPAGMTSNAALQTAKRLFCAAKAGHGGTLDPLATGLLPLCFGEATKFCQLLLESDKAYRAEIRLGVVTSTGDAEGEVLARNAVRIEQAELDAVLRRFVGPIHQVPPLYSALKRDGRPLYDYARKGEFVAREGREVTIHALRLERFDGETATVTVECSKGTYIRTLAEDIGAALGCGASLAALRRLKTGEFMVEAASTLEALAALEPKQRCERMLPVDSPLARLPQAAVDTDRAKALGQGQRVPAAGTPGTVRIYDDLGFLGVGEIGQDGWMYPKRLVVRP